MGATYIKRLTGLLSETIEIKGGKFYADGTELDNSFIKEPRDSRFWSEKILFRNMNKEK